MSTGLHQYRVQDTSVHLQLEASLGMQVSLIPKFTDWSKQQKTVQPQCWGKVCTVLPGIILNGMVQSYMVCYWMAQYNVVWYETMILNGMVQCCMEYYWMAWYSVVWNITEWHGTVLYGILLNGTVQCCMVWYWMAWYCVCWYNTEWHTTV